MTTKGALEYLFLFVGARAGGGAGLSLNVPFTKALYRAYPAPAVSACDPGKGCECE